jgi:hypothetical protein
MAAGKGLYKIDTDLSTGGFLVYSSLVWGGYCKTSEVTKCDDDDV